MLNLVLLLAASSALAQDDTDLGGPYCGLQPVLCCEGRQDNCSLPVLGTLCYCDAFCDRRRNPDCCPDYKYVCQGAEPIVKMEPAPARECYVWGKRYGDGEELHMNCNKCVCKSKNTHMELDCETNRCLIDVDRMTRINREDKHFGWRASNYTAFWGRTLEDGMKRRLGTFQSRRKVLSMLAVRRDANPGTLPRNFDARTRWRGHVTSPRDQGDCAASWVFSTVAVATDRASIMSQGELSEVLSYQHLLDCNSKNQKGCNGGFLTRAWAFINKNGLVPDDCYPWTGERGTCKVPKSKWAFEGRCHPNSVGRGKRTIFRMGPLYRVSTETGIMTEIFRHGPVQATMRVTPDFFMYSGGVFRCVNATARSSGAGFTSVRIVGWGVERKRGTEVKYWICSNSWGTDWGESGYFRVLRGVNECGVEDFVVGAWLDARKFDRAKPEEANNAL